MDDSRPTRASPKLFWQLKYIRRLKNEQHENSLKLLTFQFFFVLPLRFPRPRLPWATNNQKVASNDTEMGSSSTLFNGSMLRSYLTEKLQLIENNFSSIKKRFLGILSAHPWLEQVKILVADRPITAGIVCITSICVAFPLLAFITMSAAAVILTFLGFIFVEGTLLTIGTMFAGALMFVAACVAFPVAAFLGIAYLSLSFTVQLYSSVCDTLKQIFVTKDMNDGYDHRVRYVSGGSLSPTHPMVPSCITDSDLILSRRMAAMNGQGQHIKYEYFPVGMPFRCVANNEETMYTTNMDTAQCG